MFFFLNFHLPPRVAVQMLDTGGIYPSWSTSTAANKVAIKGRSLSQHRDVELYICK